MSSGRIKLLILIVSMKDAYNNNLIYFLFQYIFNTSNNDSENRHK